MTCRQSNVTKKLVRKRDMACRITQEPATLRPRGANFTALEVAHIYPLAALDQVRFLHLSSSLTDISLVPPGQSISIG